MQIDAIYLLWFLVGEQELASESYTLKNMTTGEQQTLDMADLLKALK